MNDLQTQVNEFSKALRVQVIEYLIQEDIYKYKGDKLNKNDLTRSIQLIYAMPCCTRLLKRLFEDAHQMHEEKGMMPHTVSIGDLEWCLKYRCVGYSSVQNVKYNWAPNQNDNELRKLPAFVSLKNLYTENKKIIAPKIEQIEYPEIAKLATELKRIA